MPHRRLSLKEAAAYLHIPSDDLEAFVMREEIPFERQGPHVVFLKKEIDVWASRRILGLPERRLASYHRRSSAQARDFSYASDMVTQLLRRECIAPDLHSHTKPSVLRDMAALAARSGLVYDPDALIATLQEREALCSTGLPGGLALLHPRHHDPYLFPESFIALGKTVTPLPFGAPDGKPTDVFFLVCCESDQIHLHVLARLCVMCSQTSLLAALREATDAEAMHKAAAASERAVIAQLPEDARANPG